MRTADSPYLDSDSSEAKTVRRGVRGCVRHGEATMDMQQRIQIFNLGEGVVLEVILDILREASQE